MTEGWGKQSYKETVLGVSEDTGAMKDIGSDPGATAEEGRSEKHLGGMDLQIVEKTHSKYECPEIIIPPSAKERLCRPWKQGLIVKLLGRRIGFKALENRLNQLWVKKGMMSIIDLGCDFFLVYLSCLVDHEKALTD